MNKICTSIEQSKKLKELGIDTDTADMHWQYIEEDNGQLQWFYFPKDFSINENESIPAWSLTALWELLPSDFDVKGEFGTSNYQIRPRKYRFSADIDVYQIAYGNYHWFKDGSNTWWDMINTSECENFVDAAFEMVCWLKENEKI